MDAPSNQDASRVTLRDIAERAKCAHSTVSLALRGDPRVKAPRRDAILKIAQELGYRRDPAMAVLNTHRRQRRLAGQGISLAFLTFQRQARPNMHETQWQALRTAAARLGYQIEQIDVDSYASLENLRRQLRRRGVRGLVIGVLHERRDLLEMDLSDFHIVSLGGIFKAHDIPTIIGSPTDVMRLCLNKLWKRGRRRIGALLLRHEPLLQDDLERLGAFLAFQHMQVAPDQRVEPLVCAPEQQEALWVDYVKQARLDGVVCFHMGMAWSLRERMGARIPEKLSVCCLHTRLESPFSGTLMSHSEQAEVAISVLDSRIREFLFGTDGRLFTVRVNPVWHEAGTI
ncbi:MAG: LacI family DNA-binding transcriptional regulator [Opitutales bacterium]